MAPTHPPPQNAAQHGNGTPVVRVEDLASGYDGRAITEHVSFTVRAGEVFGILGGSGSGKSTLLKHMIGLLPPIAGAVFIDGEDVTQVRGRARRALLRRIGVMYQGGALFGSMTLAENIKLPLEEHTALGQHARRRIAESKLHVVGLAGYEDYYPDEISGGMRKRAAIARAMALDPHILFLDEPSAGLDPVTAAELDKLILRLAAVLKITFVMVTHELASILAVVDRAIMLDKDSKGVIAMGTPHELRARKDVPFLRRFFERAEMEAEHDDPGP
jgi:phospholipid/cholesterol/gamma-HCH transport system ATP-binding protein